MGRAATKARVPGEQDEPAPRDAPTRARALQRRAPEGQVSGPDRRTRPPRAPSVPGSLGVPPISSRFKTLATQVALDDRRDRTAVVDARERWSYGELARVARWFEREFRSLARGGERVAYLIPPERGAMHVAVQLGAWRARCVAVPLATSHPLRELEHVLDDARPRLVAVDMPNPLADGLAGAAAARRMSFMRLCGPEVRTEPAERRPEDPPVRRADPSERGPRGEEPALIVYTSGTTGRPKGVVTTHAAVAAQVETLLSAWGWSPSDRILHTLPLHHIHGLINALACPLWRGATCEFGPPTPERVWDRFASGEITVFMSVPTVYARLIRAWEDARPSLRERWSEGAARMRLFVSGSAALPASTFERWRALTGHAPLERYGTTEIGMALSNPLEGERRAGAVGRPLPGVEARVVDDDGRVAAAGESGEIEVRGPQLFFGYWGRPRETAAAFRDGWFRTGDEARVDEDGCHRILGRRSVDIVKTGGYKVSAPEIEELYREHPAVADLAVVGVADADWGERLCALWVPARPGEARPTGAELRSWGKERLAPYKVPRDFLAAPELPRNAMGKVRKDLASERFQGARARSAAAAPGPAPGSAP